MTTSEEDYDLKLFTPAQIAGICEVSVETVRNWISSGQLKALKINGKYRIRRPDLVQFLDERYGESNGG